MGKGVRSSRGRHTRHLQAGRHESGRQILRAARCLVAVISLILLASCATGPVYIAKTESESMKTTYDDVRLKVLHERNQDLLRQVYARYTASRVDLYPQGLGFTALRGEKDEKVPYLMVNVRPKDIYFDENATTPEQRFGQVLREHFNKYLSLLQSRDLDREGVKGLAFGVYWPVRDYSQCDQYGGFVEYVRIYVTKESAQGLLNKRRSFQETVEEAEVLTSLEMKPAKSVRPVF